jgi:hypothetical protein
VFRIAVPIRTKCRAHITTGTRDYWILQDIVKHETQTCTDQVLDVGKENTGVR